MPNNTAKPDARTSRVTAAVTQSFAVISSKDADRKDAKEVLGVAANDAVSAREGQLVTLANASSNEEWTPHEIEDGVDQALKKTRPVFGSSRRPWSWPSHRRIRRRRRAARQAQSHAALGQFISTIPVRGA